MSQYEDVALAGRAVRPLYSEYFIHYTSRACPGMQVLRTISVESRAYVEAAFLNEFALECPTVLFITCPGSC